MLSTTSQRFKNISYFAHDLDFDIINCDLVPEKEKAH